MNNRNVQSVIFSFKDLLGLCATSPLTQPITHKRSEKDDGGGKRTHMHAPRKSRASNGSAFCQPCIRSMSGADHSCSKDLMPPPARNSQAAPDSRERTQVLCWLSHIIIIWTRLTGLSLREAIYVHDKATDRAVAFQVPPAILPGN